MDSVAEKKCAKCEALKTLTEFGKDKKRKDGLNVYCKACRRAEGAVYRRDNPESKKAAGKRYYQNNRDKLSIKSKARYQTQGEAIRAINKLWRDANPEKMRDLTYAWRKANPERNSANQAVWRKANGQKVRAQEAIRRKANAKKRNAKRAVWREENRDAERARQTAWRKANPEKDRANRNRYRALKHAAEGTHTAVDIAKQFASQGGRCWWCGCKLFKSGPNHYHVDHREPLSKGGSNGPENIVCTCPACNISKNDKSSLEFAGRLF